MANPPSAPGSLGKVFRLDGQAFWYDANHNGLYTVDPVLADVVEIFGDDNDEEVRARLEHRHGLPALRAAMDEIRQARRNEGLFLREGPPAAVPADVAAAVAATTRAGHLTLCLSEVCNLRCAYCTQESGDAYGRQVMTTKTALRALDWFAAHSTDAPERYISFYGGEPLLHPALIETVVRAARRLDGGDAIRFSLDTNATLLDERMVRFIAAEGLFLQVSLDGPPEIHDRHRRGRDGAPSHAAVLAGLRLLLEHEPAAAERIRFTATMTPPYEILTISRYFAEFPLYRELGLAVRPHVRLNVANLADVTWARPDAATRAAQWRAAQGEAHDHYVGALTAGRRATLPPALAGLLDGPLIRWHHRSRQPLGDTWFPGGACRPGVRRLFVGPDGGFLPCERLGANWRLGDVDRGLDPAAVEALHRELLDLLEDRCRTCWALRLCKMCFTSVQPDLPRPRARELAARNCAAIRRDAEELIDLYLHLWQYDNGSLDFLADTRVV